LYLKKYRNYFQDLLLHVLPHDVGLHM
jgi:hypothetical protein